MLSKLVMNSFRGVIIMDIVDFRKLYDVEEHLASEPVVYDAPGWQHEGVRPIFLEGARWNGKPTRIFAWVGMPKGASSEHKVPAIVLIHGGGATALASWVRLWNEMGYAAISMDTCGGVPVWSASPYYKERWPRHEYSGPHGWGVVEEADLPPREQWMYHAVSSVIRSTNYLLSLPEVDSSKVGVTGISWGGVLTLVDAALDGRFKFAIPVYGCGHFNSKTSGLFETSRATMPDKYRRWFELWDPAHGLSAIKMPTLFLSDAEDFAFPIPEWQRSTDEVPAPVYRSLRCNYNHDHTISWQSKTIPYFANACLTGEKLPEFMDFKFDGTHAECKLDMHGGSVKISQLWATRASGCWNDCRWRDYPVEYAGGVLKGKAPIGATAAFFSVKDDAGCTWSSPVGF